MKVIYQLIYTAALIYASVASTKGYEKSKILFAIAIATIFMILWAMQSYFAYTKTAKTSSLFVSLPMTDNGPPQIVNCSHIAVVFYENGEVVIGMTNNHCIKIEMYPETAAKFIRQFKLIANGMKKDFDM